MMSSRIFLVCLVFSGLAHGAATVQKQIAASNAWIAAPAKGETTAMAFATVENPTMYEIYIVAAAAEGAAGVELRQGGKPVKELTVPAYDSLEMMPGGAHLVLTSLEKPLQAGDTVRLSLTTEAGITLAVSAIVKPQ